MSANAAWDGWELEEAPWEVSLISHYREVLGEAPSRVLEECLEHLDGGEAEDWEEEFLIVEDAPKARLGPRMLAGLIDAALIAGLCRLAGSGETPFGAQLTFGAIAAFAYLTLSGVLGGRTLGDRAVGIRTVEAKDGERLGLGRAALRSLLVIFGWVSVVGLVWSLLDKDGQSLHDRILGTRTLPVDQP